MASPTAVTVARVAAPETYPLRATVLHGGAPPQAAKVAGDDHPDVATYAALDRAGVVIACAGLFPEPCADLSEHPGQSWRVRRVATAEQWRGRGVAAAILRSAIAHASEHGPGLIWCNATPAGARLFARAGFRQVGESWTDPDFGANVRMWREISSGSAHGRYACDD